MAKKKAVIKFEGTIEEWLSNISHEPIIYMKKPKGRAMYIWHEKNDDWFNNIARKGKSSGWHLKKDLPSLVDMYMRQGYELYIDKINE